MRLHGTPDHVPCKRVDDDGEPHRGSGDKDTRPKGIPEVGDLDGLGEVREVPGPRQTEYALKGVGHLARLLEGYDDCQVERKDYSDRKSVV